MSTTPVADTRAMNLHLGCGNGHMDGWLNCDQFPTSGTDVVFDLEKPWPLESNSAVQAYSSHVVEHLDDWQTFFREAWRVLMPGGRLLVRVPYGGHPSAWWDMGHKRPWFVENWVVFQPGYAQSIGNPEHNGWQWPYSIDLIQVRLGGLIIAALRKVRLRCLRTWLLNLARHSADAQQELYVYMTPLKSQEAVQAWLMGHHPTGLTIEYVCFTHQWEGRPLRGGEVPALHTLGRGHQIGAYV